MAAHFIVSADPLLRYGSVLLRYASVLLRYASGLLRYASGLLRYASDQETITTGHLGPDGQVVTASTALVAEMKGLVVSWCVK